MLRENFIFKHLRNLYDWVLKWSEHKHSLKALSILSFAESSFFPIPPDVLLITMGASKPKNSLKYAFYCTLFSVLGGFFGYWLGSELWTLVESYLVGGIMKAEHFEIVKQKFIDNAFLSIFIAGFTPIPYKVFTVTAGAVALPLGPFALASVLGRGARFFLVAGLLYFFGNKMKDAIEKNFEKYTMLIGVVLIALVYLIKIR